jgi:hypothetical protein
VFPKTEAEPPSTLQVRVELSVAVHIAHHLRCPVLRMGRRWFVVFGASMPVTAVYKHGYPRLSKHYVCGPAVLWIGSNSYAISEAHAMK